MELTDTSGLLLDCSEILSGPLQVSVDVTNRCNARCLHCYNRSGEVLKRDELSDEELMRLFAQIGELKPQGICFCGGEPMLRFPVIIKAARLLREAGVVFLGMVSNGWYFTEEKVREMADAGFNTVQISIDGCCAETHERMRGVPGIFGRAMAAISMLSDADVPTCVAFSPTRFNIGEFPKVVEMMEAFPAMQEVRIQPLMPMGNATENEDELFADDEDYRVLVKFINEYNSDDANRLHIAWGDPLDHLVRFPTLGFKQCAHVDIKSDGHIDISNYLPLYIGNVRKHSLKEYWDAGIGRAWSLPVSREMAHQVVSIGDMTSEGSESPRAFFDEPLVIDFIDDRPLENPEMYTLSKLMLRSQEC